MKSNDKFVQLAEKAQGYSIIKSEKLASVCGGKRRSKTYWRHCAAGVALGEAGGFESGPIGMAIGGAVGALASC